MIFSKKSQLLAYENLIAFFSILFIGFMIVMLINFNLNLQSTIITSRPDLSTQFPKVVAKTYLEFELNESEKKNLSIPINEKYYVKDLLHDTSSKKHLDIIKSSRKRFLNIFNNQSNQATIFSYYHNYLKKVNLENENTYEFELKNNDNLIYIGYFTAEELETAYKNQKVIKNDNYVYFLKNINDYILVSMFKSEKQDIDTIETTLLNNKND